MITSNQTFIPSSTKTVRVYSPADVNVEKECKVIVDDKDVMDETFAAEAPDDESVTVSKVMAKLEERTRQQFLNRHFDEVLTVDLGVGYEAFFDFKGLEELDDETYAAHYELKSVLPSNF